MKYKAEDIKNRIAELAYGMKKTTIMEVCGTHTDSIRRYGIQELLPENIRLVSGPGCPVCVTSQNDISAALSIADTNNVIFACFGDMMRVPCGDTSLYSLFERGKDIQIATSPMDALQIAKENPGKETVYFGIGFETTAPLTAALIEAADGYGVGNLSVLNAHKTMPRAITRILENGSGIDALICPGHVAAITGADAFSFVPEKLHMPAVVAGFEGYDIMAAILRVVRMLRYGDIKCVNMYPRAVSGCGNKEALTLMYRIFEPCDALWRGIGEIRGSGLKIREKYKGFDAANRFDIGSYQAEEAEGCICARILSGRSIPPDCANFGKGCTPERPLGACMVSFEGSCAAYYRYEGDNDKCEKR